MKSIQENCGVFGIFSQAPCASDIYQGIDLLQHRGQEFCGISTYDVRIHQTTHHGKVINSFTDMDLEHLTGNWGIGHVSLKERQPIRWIANQGELALAFSGNIINSEELFREMMSQGKSFQKAYDVEIISKILLETDDIPTGLTDLSGRVQGAYSLVILAKEGVYAARDAYGFRPLILGRCGNKYAVASESRALENMDMEVVRDVRPGEILLINGNGFTTLGRLESPRRAHCAFEWAYTASIDSVMDGMSVQAARNSIGAALARRDAEEGGLQADLVAPVPMSGVGHAIGYHGFSGMSYQEAFLYNRYADRSYTQSTQVAREKMAKRKLSVLHHSVKDARIVLCDDSIVRGTQILHKVRDLKRAGAREVHVRVACPPLMYPCDFGISTRSYDELMARRYMHQGDIKTLDMLRQLEAWVAERIGADSVKYNSLETFIQALGLPETDLCLKCFNGVRPTDL
ncbi:MAG: amidophosphoribosyltransferase [Proteobacteria bacterium]|nr:amidophosphoribosyltransferase [Pseudomonadota bacterium]